VIFAALIGVIEEEEAGISYEFHKMIYFMIITVTTVGYGDITPTTDESRALVILAL
jgi:hypothetical protein